MLVILAAKSDPNQAFNQDANQFAELARRGWQLIVVEVGQDENWFAALKPVKDLLFATPRSGQTALYLSGHGINQKLYLGPTPGWYSEKLVDRARLDAEDFEQHASLGPLPFDIVLSNSCHSGQKGIRGELLALAAKRWLAAGDPNIQAHIRWVAPSGPTAGCNLSFSADNKIADVNFEVGKMEW